jgi:hypothetical protein
VTAPPDLAAKHACRSALVAAGLGAVGMPADFLLARRVPDMPWYPAALSALVGVALIVLLLVRRDRATVRLGSAAFLVNSAAILAGLWVTSGYWAAAVHCWTPFQANKLGALAVAMLAPRLSVGMLCIAGYVGMAIAKFEVLAPSIQRGFPVGEPWLILFYGGFAGVLLVYRLRSVALERETLRLHAETVAAQHIARAFLRLRDYANTPIQTIQLTADVVRVRSPDLGPILDRLDRATRGLSELSRALTRYEAALRWSPDDESPNTAVLIEAALGRKLSRR